MTDDLNLSFRSVKNRPIPWIFRQQPHEKRVSAQACQARQDCLASVQSRPDLGFLVAQTADTSYFTSFRRTHPEGTVSCDESFRTGGR
jgi:hypothetical protein